MRSLWQSFTGVAPDQKPVKQIGEKHPPDLTLGDIANHAALEHRRAAGNVKVKQSESHNGMRVLEPVQSPSHQAAFHNRSQAVNARQGTCGEQQANELGSQTRVQLTAAQLRDAHGRGRHAPPTRPPAAKRACAGLQPPVAVLGEPRMVCTSSATTPSLMRRSHAAARPTAAVKGLTGTLRADAGTAPMTPDRAHRRPGYNASMAAREYAQHNHRSVAGVNVDAEVASEQHRVPFRNVAEQQSPFMEAVSPKGVRERSRGAQPRAGPVQPSASQQAELQVAVLAREPSTAADRDALAKSRPTDSQKGQLQNGTMRLREANVPSARDGASAGPSVARHVATGGVAQYADSTAASPEHARTLQRAMLDAGSRQHSRVDASTLVTPTLRDSIAATQSQAVADVSQRSACAPAWSPAPAELRGDSVQSEPGLDSASAPPVRGVWQPAAMSTQPLPAAMAHWHGFAPGDTLNESADLSTQQVLALRPQPHGTARHWQQQGAQLRSPGAIGRSVYASLYPRGRQEDEDAQIVGIGRDSTAYGGGSPALPIHANAQKFETLNESWPSLQARYEANDRSRATHRATLQRAGAENRSSPRDNAAHAHVAAAALAADETRLAVLRTARRLAEARLGGSARAAEVADVDVTVAAPSATEDSEGLVDLRSSSDEEEEADAEEDSGAVNLISSSDDDAAAVPPPSVDASVSSADGAADATTEFSLESAHRSLTAQQASVYEDIVRGAHDETVVATHPLWQIEVAKHHLSTCDPGGWLADPIINMYMALLQDRDTRWYNEPRLGKARVLYMTSHFITKMCQEAGGYDYSKVQRWTGVRKLKRIGISHYGGIRDVDKVVVPVHLGNHWTCIVANFRDQQIEYYDSLGGVHNPTISSFIQWVEDDWADKYGGDPPPKIAGAPL